MLATEAPHFTKYYEDFSFLAANEIKRLFRTFLIPSWRPLPPKQSKRLNSIFRLLPAATRSGGWIPNDCFPKISRAAVHSENLSSGSMNFGSNCVHDFSKLALVARVAPRKLRAIPYFPRANQSP